MPVDKILYTNSAADDKYINISVSEIRQIHNEIVEAYNKYSLHEYGVKAYWEKLTDIDTSSMSDEEFVKLLSRKELQLIFLKKYMRCLVHKDMVSKFVRSVMPNAGLDQQVRHLSTQDGWFVLNKGSDIPDTNEKVESGYHMLYSISLASPSALANQLKRKGRLAATTFEQLKMAYDYCCATCGKKEGTIDVRIHEVIKLQQGHMDPRKSLTLDNTIPQCQYCNQTYKDYFRFNEFGRVVAVNNPEILLQSPRDIQDEMIEILLQERQKTDNGHK